MTIKVNSMREETVSVVAVVVVVEVVVVVSPTLPSNEIMGI